MCDVIYKMWTFMASSLLVIVLVNATIDINIHQLQYVADHLGKEECRRLAEMLHHTDLYGITYNVSGEQEPDRPCILLLLKWDRTEGSNKTFNHLALRLGQIGRRDLADFLSKSIFREDDMNLREQFLSNPFRKHIPRDSVLLETGKHRKRKQSTLEGDLNNVNEEDSLSAWEIACIVCGSVVLFVIFSYMFYKLFGTVIARLFRNLAPDMIVDWCNLVQGECRWCCQKMKRKYDYHVIGRKQPRRLTDEDRNSILEQNRNLNNYMDGELESISYLFSDEDNSPDISSEHVMHKYL